VAVRILIVEDEQIIAADLSNNLRRMGHTIVGTAISSADAINMAEQVRPDLVLMDVQLEDGMSGTGSARVIQDRTGAQVIFITAFPGVFLQDPEQMTAPGICLEKPFSRIQLEAAVSAALGKRAASKADDSGSNGAGLPHTSGEER
jgi:DNA-binding response OmpR family regulator